MKHIDFKKELNEEQYKVVTAGSGAHLVLAGAGSGKTRTLVYRVAWLLEQGVKPDKILLLTFTNKAASGMMNRVREILGYRENQKLILWGGTFHAIANRLLRQYGKYINIAPDFTIIDADDSERLIKIICKEILGDIKDARRPSPGIIKEVISFAANAKIDLEESLDRKFSDWSGWLPDLQKVAAEYERRKTMSNVLDFDDLLTKWLELTRHPEAGKKLADKWEHILVDEYQDTNTVQAEIIYNLSRHIKNVLVVGDDAQSIYSFRAADVANILEFPERFKNTQIHKLETNYRSSPEILKLANSIFTAQDQQFVKNLKAIKDSCILPQLVALRSNQEEAWFVVERIRDLLEEGVSPRNIAVLFRAASNSQALELELNKRGINYEMRGGLKFFARAHIKDILSFIKILGNWRDEISWLRILQMYEGIGPITAQQIFQRFKEYKDFPELLQAKIILADKAGKSWSKISSVFEQLEKLKGHNLRELIEVVLAEYTDYLTATYSDFKQREDDLEQLALFATGYDNLEIFLNEISLQESFSGQEASNGQKDAIILSTVHQAKGLEWDAVFIINLTNQSFPHPLSSSPAEEAEEKRLFYVAVTRAIRHLYLCYPLAVFRYDGQQSMGPSPFITQLESSLFRRNDLARTTLNRSAEGVEYVIDPDYKDHDSDGFLPDVSVW
ncbi:MAG: ATP-dependent DNA helicase [Parcubacteria group bacterium]|nr:MAG: ATP-dependent DNA helicase [Parcubacteria group bacterium]